MRILIFGGKGMLGHKLVQALSPTFDVFTTIRSDFSQVAGFNIFDPENTIQNIDVSDSKLVSSVIGNNRPDVVINAVGLIKQKSSSSDVVDTLSTNAIFPHHLASMSERLGFRLILISTDCVFTGSKGNYSESDDPDALDLYGKSKHFGEITEGNVLTLRTSFIGRELGTAHSLIEWFLSNEGNRINGYANAIYSGFPTIVFADIIKFLIQDFASLKGLYHVSSTPISKFDLLTLVKDRLALDIEIERNESMRIDRSLDSSSFNSVTGFQPPAWPEMIDRMFSDPAPYDKWKNHNR